METRAFQTPTVYDFPNMSICGKMESSLFYGSLGGVYNADVPSL